MTYIITGGGTGIGRALAINLATLHQKAVIIIGRDASSLEETRTLCPERIAILQADITTETGINKVVDALENIGTEVALINNAGIADPLTLSDITLENMQAHLNINFIAPTILTKKLLPHLTGGRVLFISTGLAHNAGPGMFSYGTSKAAMYHGWQYWKSEHPTISFGIAQPGMVDTNMQTRLRNTPPAKLPMLDFFTGTHQKQQLLPPDVSAKFLSWLLLNTQPDAFSANEWNIYDKSHWVHWASENEVVVRDATAFEKKH